VEIKNMNTFSGVRRALTHEIERQIGVLNSGGRLVQETRRWDDVGGITESMRTKEMAHDYRYFPEPDLMPFEPDDAWIARVREYVVELPMARKQRLMREYQLPAADAQAFVWDAPLGEYFEGIARQAGNPKAVANWLINNLRGRLSESGGGLADLKFKPEALVELVAEVESGRISGKIAQEVFGEMFNSGESPGVIIGKKGWAQESDSGVIDRYCEEAIAANPGSVADYRAGKAAALNFLKGQVMKLSRGRANPSLAGEILERKLKS
jgi:aspartyl-tRNA(Asn)/glutamyl-tRNA(Gln) amidotransferase subunit B